MSYYRVQAASVPTAQLLDPELQYSFSYANFTERHGISVCDSPEELADYLAQTGVPIDDTFVLVELDGPDSDEQDEDAHLGARLILSTTIRSITPVSEGFLDLVDAAFDAIGA